MVFHWNLSNSKSPQVSETLLRILADLKNVVVWRVSPCLLIFKFLVSVQVVHPYSSIDTTAAWKKLRFILSVRSDFHMIDSLSIAVHAFVSRVLMSFSVDETLLLKHS